MTKLEPWTIIYTAYIKKNKNSVTTLLYSNAKTPFFAYCGLFPCFPKIALAEGVIIKAGAIPSVLHVILPDRKMI